MTIQAVRCEACGGAVAMKAGTEAPACLFCGEKALVPLRADQQVELPQQVVPFEADAAKARDAFRAFAKSSFWYPGDLRNAQLDLKRILLPGWVWSATVEAHYIGLVADTSTRSDKRPVTGTSTVPVAGVLVPSSTAVSRKELQTVAPFAVEAAKPFVEDEAEAPFELASLTRVAAKNEALVALREMVVAKVKGQVHASRLNASIRCHELDGQTLYFPVYVGAYRYKDKLYRAVINGQSGKISATAPISWTKVAMVVGLVMALFGGLAVCMGAGAGVGAMMPHTSSVSAPSAPSAPAPSAPASPAAPAAPASGHKKR